MDYFDTSLIERGGPLMWVLLFLSMLGSVIFLERVLFLHRGQIRTAQFLDGIRNLILKGRRLEALTLCEDMPGPIPGIIKSILLEADAPEENMRAAAESAALVEIPILERRVGVLASLARVAPLVGLLGTVLGVTEAFLGLSAVSGTSFASFDSFLTGVGEALLTTGFGLVVAIMAHLAHHFLHGRVRALVHDMEYTSHELIQFLCHRTGDTAPEEGRLPESKG
jgi:biopolymer transport protein ExbB